MSIEYCEPKSRTTTVSGRAGATAGAFAGQLTHLLAGDLQIRGDLNIARCAYPPGLLLIRHDVS